MIETIGYIIICAAGLTLYFGGRFREKGKVKGIGIGLLICLVLFVAPDFFRGFVDGFLDGFVE